MAFVCLNGKAAFKVILEAGQTSALSDAHCQAGPQAPSPATLLTFSKCSLERSTGLLDCGLLL